MNDQTFLNTIIHLAKQDLSKSEIAKELSAISISWFQIWEVISPHIEQEMDDLIFAPSDQDYQEKLKKKFATFEIVSEESLTKEHTSGPVKNVVKGSDVRADRDVNIGDIHITINNRGSIGKQSFSKGNDDEI